MMPAIPIRSNQFLDRQACKKFSSMSVRFPVTINSELSLWIQPIPCMSESVRIPDHPESLILPLTWTQRDDGWVDEKWLEEMTGRVNPSFSWSQSKFTVKNACWLPVCTDFWLQLYWLHTIWFLTTDATSNRMWRKSAGGTECRMSVDEWTFCFDPLILTRTCSLWGSEWTQNRLSHYWNSDWFWDESIFLHADSEFWERQYWILTGNIANFMHLRPQHT